MKRMLQRGAVLLGVVLALLIARPVAAQALLLGSDPVAGAQLESAPSSIRLEFSEDLDPAFSGARLVDGQGRQVEPGPGEVNLAEPRVLRLILPDLPAGSYTALWRVRSAADGSIAQGVLPFGVGIATSATALIPPLGAPDPARLTPPLLETIARWLNLLAATLALGGLPFGLLVWRPVLRTIGGAERETGNGDRLLLADEGITRFIRRSLALGGLLFLLTNALLLLVQAATAANLPLLQALGWPVLALLSGRSGLLWLARMALVVQVVVLARRLPPIGVARLWWAMLTIGGVVLLTLSLQSHAAASPSSLVAVPLDWLHLIAMLVWLGGLPPLACAIGFVLRQPSNGAATSLLLRALIRRYGWLSAACTMVLALTGGYSYLQQVGTPDLLLSTTYGRALLLKFGLFVAVLALLAVGLFLLARRGAWAGQAPARCLAAALVAGALLLLLVGAMASVAPSTIAWEQHEQQGIAQSATQGLVELTLRIAPAQVGDNEFAVDLRDGRPGAAAAPAQVALRFDMLGMAMEQVQAQALPSGAERYVTRGGFTAMGGRWQIEVLVRRAGFEDVAHTFQVDIVRGAPFVIGP